MIRLRQQQQPSSLPFENNSGSNSSSSKNDNGILSSNYYPNNNHNHSYSMNSSNDINNSNNNNVPILDSPSNNHMNNTKKRRRNNNKQQQESFVVYLLSEVVDYCCFRSQTKTSNNSNHLFHQKRQRYPSKEVRILNVVMAISVTIIIVFIVAVLLKVRFATNKKNDNNHLYHSSSVRINMQQYIQKQLPLQDIDYKYYTIRINTWERMEQLQMSIQHHLTCSNILQIQIIWCIDQTITIPQWLIDMEQTISPIIYNTQSYPRIVIERHTINSLNERFHLLSPIYTAGILSIDDDVIRPCIALDYTFYIWIQNPDRQVGFDARSHEISTTSTGSSSNINVENLNDNSVSTNKKHHHHNHHKRHVRNTQKQSDANKTATTQTWKYSYMSVTEKTNLYSLTLTRYSFLHQYYMKLYMYNMSSIIRDTIQTNFNCEDIAMSMFISSCHIQHLPPLLTQYWAIKSQIKLYVGNKKISGTNNHKILRDHCVHNFSQILHLQPISSSSIQQQIEQPPLLFHTYPLYLGTPFDYGIEAENWNHVPITSLSEELQKSIAIVDGWKEQYTKAAETAAVDEQSQPQQDPLHNLHHHKEVLKQHHQQQQPWMMELKQLRDEAIQPIYDAGMIEKTPPWKERFHTS